MENLCSIKYLYSFLQQYKVIALQGYVTLSFQPCLFASTAKQFAMWLIMGISYLLHTWLVHGAAQAPGVVLIVSDKLIQSGKGNLIRHVISTN